MLDLKRWFPPPGSVSRVGVVSTFPPTRCGIGRFASSMVDALAQFDPGLEIDVVRLVNGRTASPVASRARMEIDPSSPVSIRAAGRHLGSCDVAILQHEFGIYGAEDGAAVLDLATQIDAPKVAVLHTVLPEPTARQRSIIESLSMEATIVVLCESARDLLVSGYSVDDDAIVVIPHGTHWSPQQINHSPRRRLITWGLLGPGKGLERSIAAVAELRDLDPPLHYRIVGRTHPAVAAESGFRYRRSLERLVHSLDLSHVVEFIDRYVDDVELFEMVRRSDVVVVPYDNHDQVSSGVITEAVGMARPVVATRFPYAVEILGSGRGLAVDHDVLSVARGIRELVEDPVSYRDAARAAALKSAELSWDTVAARYSRLIHRLGSARATA